jgi:hypothetical protein
MDEMVHGCIGMALVADFTPQMPFVKNIKSDAYYSRYQVKYRRRREGKTDCMLLALLIHCDNADAGNVLCQITRANG